MIGPIIPSLLESRKSIHMIQREQYGWVLRCMKVYMDVFKEHAKLSHAMAISRDNIEKHLLSNNKFIYFPDRPIHNNSFYKNLN